MAQGELYMLGGYFCYFASVTLGIGYFPAIILAMIAAAGVGVLMDRLAVRPLLRRPFYMVFLSTFAVSMILENAAELVWGPDPQSIPSPFSSSPIVIGPVFLTSQKLFIFAVALITIVSFAAFLRWTRVGMAIRALARDRDQLVERPLALAADDAILRQRRQPCWFVRLQQQHHPTPFSTRRPLDGRACASTT